MNPPQSTIYVPSDRGYTNDHMWVKPEGSMARIGITDTALGSFGDVVFVDLHGKGKALERRTSFSWIESFKPNSEPHDAKILDRLSSLRDISHGQRTYVTQLTENTVFYDRICCQRCTPLFEIQV